MPSMLLQISCAYASELICLLDKLSIKVGERDRGKVLPVLHLHGHRSIHVYHKVGLSSWARELTQGC